VGLQGRMLLACEGACKAASQGIQPGLVTQLRGCEADRQHAQCHGMFDHWGCSQSHGSAWKQGVMALLVHPEFNDNGQEVTRQQAPG
jgi:hypothetical protein